MLGLDQSNPLIGRPKIYLAQEQTTGYGAN
jgi:hypothetical protein